jgi:hypothetical protein
MPATESPHKSWPSRLLPSVMSRLGVYWQCLFHRAGEF